MLTYLYVLSGPLKGYKLRLEPGFTLGRKSATFNLKDFKASEIHCTVTEKGKHLYLIDNQAKNGLYLNGSQVMEIKLEAGQEIRIGKTLLKVQQPKAAKGKGSDEKENKKDYKQVLSDAFTDYAERIANPTDMPDPIALSPPLRLNFIRGLQTGTSWVLGYGPRSIGTASIDLNIFQKDAPLNCFEIKPTKKGNLFTTKSSDVVLLNGKSVKSRILKEGDLIHIIDTEIKVELFL